MIQKSIAVIGGGMSSLSAILMLSKKLQSKNQILQVSIFERKERLGGRITVQQSPQEQQHQHLFSADVGANFIDYETEEEKKIIENNIPKNIMQNLKHFDGKFFIFENNKLQQCAKQKQKMRYFYEGGFNKLPEDFRKEIQKYKNLKLNIQFHQVQKVERSDKKWRLTFQGQNKKSQFFDILIFGTPAPLSRTILQLSPIEQAKNITKELEKFKYSKQLSAIFQIQENSQQQSGQKPYSILFRNHDIAFICLHNQKYPHNQKNIAVIQMYEQFTQKWSHKLSPQNIQARTSHNQIQKQVGQEIWSLIPEDIKKKCNISKKCLEVYYWPQSQVIPRDQIKSRDQLFKTFNNELNKDFTDQQGKRSLYFTGDYLNNKSRVSGAMVVGIKLSQRLAEELF